MAVFVKSIFVMLPVSHIFSYILFLYIFIFQVEDKLSNLEANLMDMMMRLDNLSQGVDFLKNKTEQNRQQAKEAKMLSDNTTQAASELKKVHSLSTVMPLHFLSLCIWTEFRCLLYFVCVCVFVPGFVTC